MKEMRDAGEIVLVLARTLRNFRLPSEFAPAFQAKRLLLIPLSARSTSA